MFTKKSDISKKKKKTRAKCRSDVLVRHHHILLSALPDIRHLLKAQQEKK